MRKAILAGIILAGFLLSPTMLPAEYVVSYNPAPLPTPVILISPQSPPDAGIGAIAVPDVLCESGGEETAIGDIDLGVSLGIYQINISYWPLLHKRYNLLDAADNAQAAYVVWKSMGFKAWSCYDGKPVPIQSISN